MPSIINKLNNLHYIRALLGFIGRSLYIIGFISLILIISIYGSEFPHLLWITVGLLTIPILLRIFIRTYIDHQITIQERKLARYVHENKIK